MLRRHWTIGARYSLNSSRSCACLFSTHTLSTLGVVALNMSSRNQDYLAQYYSEAPQQASDYESKPKKKKVARAPTKQLQGFKMIDDNDTMEDFEELGPLVPEKSTPCTRAIQRTSSSLFANGHPALRFANLLSAPLFCALEGSKVIDLTAESVKKELEQSQRPSQSFGSLDSSPPRQSNSQRRRVPQVDQHHDRSSAEHATSGDISPPRQRSAQNDSSPVRRPRSQDTGISPVRRLQTEASPPRSANNDLSPVRRRNTPVSDISPPRRGRSDAQDISPPRKVESSDLSPPRHRVKSEFDDPMADHLSPPRQARGGRGDLSPSISSRTGGDLSPPRSRAKRELTDEHTSSGANDLSPPRTRRDASPEVDKYSMRMTNGERAGLQSGAEITAEARKRRIEENARLSEMTSSAVDDELATQTVHRDATGRRIVPKTAEQIAAEEQQAKKSKWAPVERPSDERYAHADRDGGRSSRGRTSEDAGRNTGKSSRDRWGDPLAQLKASGAVRSDDEDDMDFDDPIRKFKKRKREPKEAKRSDTYSGWFPPNRYDLRPGALWDGVDRSNGFENKMYQAQIDRLHHAEAAYRYTSADM